MNEHNSTSPGSNPVPAPTRSIAIDVREALSPEMKRYREAIDGTDVHSVRLAAIASENAELARLNAAAEARDRARATEQTWQARERDAERTVAAAPPDGAAAAAAALRDVRAGSEAASRESRSTDEHYARVLKDCEAAKSNVKRAVRIAVRCTDAQRVLDAHARAEADALTNRELGLALALVLPGLFTDQELYSLAYRRPFTSEFTHGCPAPPLMALRPGDHFEDRPDSGRVNKAAAEWRARIAALCEGRE